jgi:hypothetical protein
MRTFGFVGNKIVRADEGQAPDARRASVNSSRGRRLDDSIRDIFDRACATNNLEAAADLLTLMEKWHLRRQANYGRERRISGDDLERARKELKAQALRELARLTKLRDEKGAGGRAENAASG